MQKRASGEWIKPDPKQFQLGCCDCGLVHRIDFRIVNGQVQFRAYRDSFATQGLRKDMGVTWDK